MIRTEFAAHAPEGPGNRAQERKDDAELFHVFAKFLCKGPVLPANLLPEWENLEGERLCLRGDQKTAFDLTL